MDLADEISDGQQCLGRIFRRCWSEHGKHEPGHTARVRTLRLAASGKRCAMARTRAAAYCVGENHAEVAKIYCSRGDRHYRTGRRQIVLLQLAESVLRQSQLKARCS